VDITYVPEITNALPVPSKTLDMQETFAQHRFYYIFMESFNTEGMHRKYNLSKYHKLKK